MVTEADRVDALVKDFRRRYADAVLRCGELADSKGQPGLSWPDWCWLPMGGFDQYLQSSSPGTAFWDLAKVAALTQWRLGRGVYIPGPDVTETAIAELYDSGGLAPGQAEQWHKAKLPPVSAWQRLPEWCCYIAMPESGRPAGSPLGVFVHLEHDMNNHRPELRLLIDTDGTWDRLLPIPLYLDRPNLGAAIGDADQSTQAVLEHGAIGTDVRSLTTPGAPWTVMAMYAWQVLPSH